MPQLWRHTCSQAPDALRRELFCYISCRIGVLFALRLDTGWVAFSV